jgi:hypothetical protein
MTNHEKEKDGGLERGHSKFVYLNPPPLVFFYYAVF